MFTNYITQGKNNSESLTCIFWNIYSSPENCCRIRSKIRF